MNETNEPNSSSSICDQPGAHSKVGDSLTGRFLIAMPNIGDERFDRTVIYVFAHESSGAMGLIINRTAQEVAFQDLLSQLDLKITQDVQEPSVRIGGPVETERGFVLHSPDYHHSDSTLKVDDAISMTATVDVLQAIAKGDGPRNMLFALGYAGWGPGQLEDEIQQNGWLECEADADIVFDAADDTKWTRALAKLGVTPLMLSTVAGRA